MSGAKRRIVSIACALMLTTVVSGVSASALDFNEEPKNTQAVTTQEVTTEQVTKVTKEKNEATKFDNQAEAVGSLFQGGITQESSQEAQQITSGTVKMINLIISIILGILTAVLFLMTAVDLVFIGVPFTRKWLSGGENVSQGAGTMSGGYGSSYGGGYGSSYGGGYGGGYGGMSGNYGGGYGSMSGGAGNHQGGVSGALGRIVSDEAISAVQESGASPDGKKKSSIVSYLKKRVVFLVVFGVCAVMLFGTVFTDIGLKLGTWIANALSNLL